MLSTCAYGVPVDWNRLPLSRAAVDRAAARRAEPDLLERAWAAPTTRVLLVRGAAVTVRHDGDDVALELRATADLTDPADGPDAGLWIFLGEEPGEPGGAGPVAYLACVVTDDGVVADVADVPRGPAGGSGPMTWATLRDVGHRLGDRDAGLAAIAVGLAAWHERNPRCPRCGGQTVPQDGGWVRRCAQDGSDHYPRTDPAVIMAVTDDQDRLLLGHAAHWPERRFSTLAGYVEPGESLEAAVRREVAEEVAVVVGEVTYRGSQPWPFPASLMLAFVARALTTDVVVDGEEVTDARWFTRASLAAAVDDGEVLLPMRTSVARVLIEEWFGGELPGE